MEKSDVPFSSSGAGVIYDLSETLVDDYFNSITGGLDVTFTFAGYIDGVNRTDEDWSKESAQSLMQVPLFLINPLADYYQDHKAYGELHLTKNAEKLVPDTVANVHGVPLGSDSTDKVTIYYHVDGKDGGQNASHTNIYYDENIIAQMTSKCENDLSSSVLYGS